MAWYYIQNNQQTGPVDEAAIKELVSAGTISTNTQVWQDGMVRWQPILTTPLATLFPQQGPPPIVLPTYAAVPLAAPTERIKQIQLFFNLYWIFMVVGLALCLTLIGIILGVPALITGVVFYFILLYKLWCIVQDGQAQTTPGKAVGFSFIPFFNLYWQFVALWGLSKDLNRYAQQHNPAAPPANEGLALAACILNCCAVIPYLGILIGIAALIVTIIALKGMCNTAAAIIH